MKKQNFLKAMANIQEGRFVNVCYKSVKEINGSVYEKVTNTIVRFVNYANINGVDCKGQTNPNQHNDIECKYLKYNEKTGSTLVAMATTTIPNYKPTIQFLKDKIEISRQDYEMVIVPHKSNKPLVWFTIKLENLISINGITD